MNTEKFEEDAEQDVDEQFDPHAKLNLPSESDSEDSENEKKNSPILFKSKRNFNSKNQNQTKKIKTQLN